MRMHILNSLLFHAEESKRVCTHEEKASKIKNTALTVKISKIVKVPKSVAIAKQICPKGSESAKGSCVVPNIITARRVTYSCPKVMRNVYIDQKMYLNDKRYKATVI